MVSSRVLMAVVGVLIVAAGAAFVLKDAGNGVALGFAAVGAIAAIAIYSVGQGEGGLDGKTRTDIDDSVRRLKDGVTGHLGSVDETSRLARDLASSIKDVSTHAETLASSAEESSSSILEMTATHDEVAENIGELAGSVRETVSSIEEMAYSIKEVAKNVDSRPKRPRRR